MPQAQASPSTNPIRIGVIGFGKLGLLHAGVVNAVQGSQLAAIADTSSTMLSFLRSKMPNVKTYEDYRVMLKEKAIDAAYIATPTGSHVPIAVDCVEQGLPIFIEKPLGLTYDQCLPLLKALDKNKVVNMVGYMGRYTDTFGKAKAILNDGVLGKYQLLKSSMYIGQLFRRGKGWRYDPAASGGGVLMTQNAHLVDKLLWFFGDLDYVSAHTSNLYSEKVEDAAHVYFAFKNGLRGYLDSSWSARHYRTIQMSIFVQGENGTLEVNDDCIKLFLDEKTGNYKEGWTQWRKPDLYEGVSFDIGGPAYTLQAEEFINAIRSATPITSTVQTAFETQIAIEAAYRSARNNGQPVSIREVKSS